MSVDGINDHLDQFLGAEPTGPDLEKDLSSSELIAMPPFAEKLVDDLPDVPGFLRDQREKLGNQLGNLWENLENRVDQFIDDRTNRSRQEFNETILGPLEGGSLNRNNVFHHVEDRMHNTK